MVNSQAKTNPPLDPRHVRHCPHCDKPMIMVPVLGCSHCGRERALRAFTYQAAPNRYIAECIDLDLLAQGSVEDEAIGRLQEAMIGYLQAAYDGQSTKGLVLRPSPFTHRIRYYWHQFWNRLPRAFSGRHTHLLPQDETARPSYRVSHC